jgi:chemotaxis protein methyltransferase CheR
MGRLGDRTVTTRCLSDRDREMQWPLLSELIAQHIGLHFPRERWADLQRGMAGAAAEFGFDDVTVCADWLLSAPLTRTQLQVLASHLTIGETYFFRDKNTFDVLASHVLPDLIHARRGREQRLRLWSAACCSGEEAYSLAILLHQLLPDLADWHVTILATDINPRFLLKAVEASYGEWSFRDAPSGLKERYFNQTGNGAYVIRPDIKKLVTFDHLNLAEDVYPSVATGTNAMDVIFCRNVLMYFTSAQIRKVIGNLHQALTADGWLAVSASEASHALFPQFVIQNFPGVILYQNGSAGPPSANHVPWMPPATATQPLEAPAAPAPEGWPTVESVLPPLAVAVSLYEQGRYEEAADTLLVSFEKRQPETQALSLLARALANQGRLPDALAWCDRWIAADKLDAAGHYLRAVVLLERGHQDEARGSLQRALYLEPNFVLAHFALGSLARGHHQHDEADKHFANTLDLLGRLQPHDVLPESDGLTAGRLIETITAMAAPGHTR